MPRSTRFVPAFIAFTMAVAGAPSLSAQSPDTRPNITIDVDAQLRAQEDAMKATEEAIRRLKVDPKIEIKIAEAEAKAGELAAKKIAGLDGRIFEFDAKFQRGPTPMAPMVRRGSEDQLYQSALRALDGARWDEAVATFQRVIQQAGPRADGATYWTAWAQSKQGNGVAALQSLGQLRQGFPNSKWLAEGRALEVEIRQATGQPVRPESVPDDELKLIAVNSLMRADEQKAIPVIDKILRGTGSPRLKERALFVLAQNSTTPARQIVVDIAKGDSMKAANMTTAQARRFRIQTPISIRQTFTGARLPRRLPHRQTHSAQDLTIWPASKKPIWLDSAEVQNWIFLRRRIPDPPAGITSRPFGYRHFPSAFFFKLSGRVVLCRSGNRSTRELNRF